MEVFLPVVFVTMNSGTFCFSKTNSIPETIEEGSLPLSLHSDPDLHGVPTELRPQALQSLYICTGCDYGSLFRGVGKVSYLSTIFQYASFIADSYEAPG